MTALLVRLGFISQERIVCHVLWIDVLLVHLSANALSVNQVFTLKPMAAAYLAHLQSQHA